VRDQLRRLFAEQRPNVAHFHNTFPLISPSAYYAARDEGVAVVQTLHNYRLLCPSSVLFRDGHICEDCLGRAIPWPGVVHACYRGSLPASAVSAATLVLHRALGTWTHLVDVYVALTEFARQKFIEGGLPAEKLVVKPNFLADDPGVGMHEGGFALFVGRLAPEKGIVTLLQAWASIGTAYPLKIVGSGPLEALAHQLPPGVELLGQRSTVSVIKLMKEASFLIFPSEWYEGFPMTLVEAFATGLPVLASSHGSTAEIVRDHETGRVFAAGDSDELAATVNWALLHPSEVTEMGRAARREFETKYTPGQNYERLMDIYRRAVGT